MLLFKPTVIKVTIVPTRSAAYALLARLPMPATLPTEPVIALYLQLLLIVLLELLLRALLCTERNEFGGDQLIIPSNAHPLELRLLV